MRMTTNKLLFAILLSLTALPCCSIPFDEDRGKAQRVVELFASYPDKVPYRIPAIAQTKKGKIVAVSDYRYCESDIGFGRIDLHQRCSNDGGKTWGEETTIAQGNAIKGAWNCGFGDASIVCDKDDGTLLLICVCGSTPYFAPTTTRDNPNRMVRMYSHDGGKSWTLPEDFTESIYTLFDEGNSGPIQSMFVASGRIFQSNTIREGSHHRIYAALCARPNGNRVIYSDDFGKSWNILGTANDLPVPQGDEPKCAELPDGNVLISSRTYGGRWYNIFRYSNKDHSKGEWGKVAISNKENNGTASLENACNGGILMVPAKRNNDGKSGYVLLQSVPFGPDRVNVGIYYKGLFNTDDWTTPERIASNWEGNLQCSRMRSAYSEFLLLKNKRIAFIYEERTHDAYYTICFRTFSLQEITNGKYKLP